MKPAAYLAVAVLVAWLSWLLRYEPTGDGRIILDRWTGEVVLPHAHRRQVLHWKEPEWESADFDMDDLRNARAVGYTDPVILGRLAHRWPEFKLSAARAEGHTDTEILEYLIQHQQSK